MPVVRRWNGMKIIFALCRSQLLVSFNCNAQEREVPQSRIFFVVFIIKLCGFFFILFCDLRLENCSVTVVYYMFFCIFKEFG